MSKKLYNPQKSANSALDSMKNQQLSTNKNQLSQMHKK